MNVIAPFALTAALLPALSAARGVVLDISSDAGVEHYPDWGGYGASKAALDHLTITFGVENLDIACYAVDPGDMRTDMQQAAFPGEDISDRTAPSAVVPALLGLISSRPPSGRYRAADIAATAGPVAWIGGVCMSDAAGRPVDDLQRARRPDRDRTRRAPRPGQGPGPAAGRVPGRHHPHHLPRAARAAQRR